jgi:hypothetical protein
MLRDPNIQYLALITKELSFLTQSRLDGFWFCRGIVISFSYQVSLYIWNKDGQGRTPAQGCLGMAGGGVKNYMYIYFSMLLGCLFVWNIMVANLIMWWVMVREIWDFYPIVAILCFLFPNETNVFGAHSISRAFTNFQEIVYGISFEQRDKIFWCSFFCVVHYILCNFSTLWNRRLRSSMASVSDRPCT